MNARNANDPLSREWLEGENQALRERVAQLQEEAGVRDYDDQRRNREYDNQARQWGVRSDRFARSLTEQRAQTKRFRDAMLRAEHEVKRLRGVLAEALGAWERLDPGGLDADRRASILIEPRSTSVPPSGSK